MRLGSLTVLERARLLTRPSSLFSSPFLPPHRRISTPPFAHLASPASLPFAQTLFWENLAPQSQGGGQFPSSGKLHDQVQQDFGGLDGLKKAVNAAALGIQGSGWAWLGYNPTTKKLEAVSTANQDPLLGYVPLVGIDMWVVLNAL